MKEQGGNRMKASDRVETMDRPFETLHPYPIDRKDASSLQTLHQEHRRDPGDKAPAIALSDEES